jgi:hypothetical protein
MTFCPAVRLPPAALAGMGATHNPNSISLSCQVRLASHKQHPATEKTSMQSDGKTQIETQLKTVILRAGEIRVEFC